MKKERTIKEDGRYLIYYSWVEEEVKEKEQKDKKGDN
jgi:hypothetical protein